MEAQIEMFEIWGGLPPEGSEPFDKLVAYCQSNDAAIWAGLPWLASEISYSSGFDKMLSFVKNNSGASLYVSADRSSFNDRHNLALSEKEHDHLMLNSDNRGSICVPSAWGILLAIRRAALRMAIEATLDDREIARIFGASIRYVKKERREYSVRVAR